MIKKAKTRKIRRAGTIISVLLSGQTVCNMDSSPVGCRSISVSLSGLLQNEPTGVAVTRAVIWIPEWRLIWLLGQMSHSLGGVRLATGAATYNNNNSSNNSSSHSSPSFNGPILIMHIICGNSSNDTTMYFLINYQ